MGIYQRVKLTSEQRIYVHGHHECRKRVSFIILRVSSIVPRCLLNAPSTLNLGFDSDFRSRYHRHCQITLACLKVQIKALSSRPTRRSRRNNGEIRRLRCAAQNSATLLRIVDCGRDTAHSPHRCRLAQLTIIH
jgi:hypothetical protein